MVPGEAAEFENASLWSVSSRSGPRVSGGNRDLWTTPRTQVNSEYTSAASKHSSKSGPTSTPSTPGNRLDPDRSAPPPAP